MSKKGLVDYLKRKDTKTFYPSKFADGAFTVHDVVELVEERKDIERVYKVLCPKCRGEIGSASKLAALTSKEVECSDCNITFSPDFTQVLVAYKQG